MNADLGYQGSLITLVPTVTWRGGILCYNVTIQPDTRPREGH
jgi:hypothetical protein